MVMIDLPSPGNGALDLAPSWCCKGSEDIGTCFFVVVIFGVIVIFLGDTLEPGLCVSGKKVHFQVV